jgi:hypothetical protein
MWKNALGRSSKIEIHPRMNPKTLQYLMGHSEIGVTLNTYAHVDFEDAVAEVTRLGIV